jgi:hypothetical protein
VIVHHLLRQKIDFQVCKFLQHQIQAKNLNFLKKSSVDLSSQLLLVCVLFVVQLLSETFSSWTVSNFTCLVYGLNKNYLFPNE